MLTGGISQERAATIGGAHTRWELCGGGVDKDRPAHTPAGARPRAPPGAAGLQPSPMTQEPNWNFNAISLMWIFLLGGFVIVIMGGVKIRGGGVLASVSAAFSLPHFFYLRGFLALSCCLTRRDLTHNEY